MHIIFVSSLQTNFSRKTTFENHYQNNLNYHSQLLDIGDFKEIPVLSNPKLWTVEDVYEYLSTDVHCEEIKNKLLKEVNVNIIIDFIIYYLL